MLCVAMMVKKTIIATSIVFDIFRLPVRLISSARVIPGIVKTLLSSIYYKTCAKHPNSCYSIVFT